MDRFRTVTRQVTTCEVTLVSGLRRVSSCHRLWKQSHSSGTKKTWRDGIVLGRSPIRACTHADKGCSWVGGHNFLWLRVSKCLPSIQVLQRLTTNSYLILCGVHTDGAAEAPGGDLLPCTFAGANCEIIPYSKLYTCSSWQLHSKV